LADNDMPDNSEDSTRAALDARLREDPSRCPRCSSTKLVHVRGSLASGSDVRCEACRCRWSTVWSKRKAYAALVIVLVVFGYAATQVVLNLLRMFDSVPDPEAASSVRAYGVMLAAALFFSFPFVMAAVRVLRGRAWPRVQELGEK
jgi:hypothetical protein